MEPQTMEKVDRQAIEGLFDKLANVERRSPPRDDAAEAFIGDKIARQPHAPYYMAQTIVVQEQALNAAQARIEELEREGDRPGGLMTSIFGGRERQPDGSVPRTGRTRPAASEPARDPLQRSGGGFLAGAAQTAMGVTGGILLGNLIAGMFGADQAKAAEPQPDSAADDRDAQDGDGDDGSDDGGFGDDIGFGDFDV
jgi:hypothetical protein